MSAWFEFENHGEVLTPAVMVYPQRIKSNIEAMIKIAGEPSRLRPHVKTHKCADIVKLQIERGIHKFKCATLSEAFMLGASGASDVLIAYPLIGPAIDQFLSLNSHFPNTQFSFLIDHADQLKPWASQEQYVNVYIDLNVGMNRTGCSIKKAARLLKLIHENALNFRGWHAYDGHIHDEDPELRKNTVEKTFEPIVELVEKTGTQNKELICGGSITFPIHATYENRQLSPGTTLLWDYGYASSFPDLPFEIAAILMARVVSKPGANKICIDLGHKAIAAEMKAPVATFPEIPDAVIEVHSEEHMVISTSAAQHWNIGDRVFAIPYHICPSMALHNKAIAVEHQTFKEFWVIDARDRFYLHF